MKKRIEDMIAPSLRVIQAELGDEAGSVEVPRTFSGSISGLGATIAQMGILPALAVYAAEQSGAKEGHRRQILDIVSQVVADYASNQSTISGLESLQDGQGLFLLAADWQRERATANLEALRAVLLDAAIAVKLSLRTYKRAEV